MLEMSVLLSVCPLICLSVCLSHCVTVGLSLPLFDCSSVCLSVCLSICVYISVCLSICWTKQTNTVWESNLKWLRIWKKHDMCNREGFFYLLIKFSLFVCLFIYLFMTVFKAAKRTCPRSWASRDLVSTLIPEFSLM